MIFDCTEQHWADSAHILAGATVGGGGVTKQWKRALIEILCGTGRVIITYLCYPAALDMRRIYRLMIYVHAVTATVGL